MKFQKYLEIGLGVMLGLALILTYAVVIFDFRTGSWKGIKITRVLKPSVVNRTASAQPMLEPPAEALCIPEHKSATLYRAGSGRLVWTSFGYVEEVQGTREIQSTAGVDWEIVEECNLLLLYNIEQGEGYVLVLFAPPGFPLKEVYKRPFMGARNLSIKQDPNHLLIEAGGAKIGR